MLTVLRGLPGSGKSRWANGPFPHEKVIASADLWFETTGTSWAGKHLEEAHAWAKEQARVGFEKPNDDVHVIADNTHSRLWEFRPYVQMAEEAGHDINIFDFFDGARPVEFLALRNVHNVSHAKIVEMAERWEPAGDRLNDSTWCVKSDGGITRREMGTGPTPTLIRLGGEPKEIETMGSLFEARKNFAKFTLSLEQGTYSDDDWVIRETESL